MLRMSVLFEPLATAADPPIPWPPSSATVTEPSGPPSPPMPSRPGRPAERHVVLVVSPDDEPTRPVVAANLAAVYAEADQRVIVARTSDLGIGRPVVIARPAACSQARSARSTSKPGWSAPGSTSVFRLPLTLFLQNSGQLVTRGRELLDAARSVSDVIIIETPSLLSVHHAEALSHAVDVVVVVGECRRTRISEAKRASAAAAPDRSPGARGGPHKRPSHRPDQGRATVAGTGGGPTAVASPNGSDAVAPSPSSGRPPLCAVGSDEPTAPTQV